MTPQEIISDDEIARVHGNANFGAMDPREVVNDGVRKTAVGYHCGSTQLHILRDHGLVTKPRSGSSDVDLTKKGKAYARSIYRDTTPAQAEAQDEGAEMTRLLKLADSALANVTAFEDDARYIMGNTNYAITENARSEIRSFLLAQSAKTSVRPKALEILDRLLDHSGARGSFDAMKHGDAVKDAEELLRSARSPGHTDLMVTPESIDAYMKDNPMEAHAADEDRVGEATGAKAVIRDEQIVISIDVDALPGILSGSIATNSVAGLFKVSDPIAFAKEVCGALNAENEDGTTRVHMMFDSAFNHAIDQGAEGVEEITEDEFEADAQRIQSEALAALKSEGRA